MTYASYHPRKTYREKIEGRLLVAKINGGAAAAEPREAGRFTVTGRRGDRYTVWALGDEFSLRLPGSGEGRDAVLARRSRVPPHRRRSRDGKGGCVMPKVTPLTRDPVERAAIERELAGDPLGALEIMVADIRDRSARIGARLDAVEAQLTAAPAAFRRAAEQQRREQDERDERRASLSAVDSNAEETP